MIRDPAAPDARTRGAGQLYYISGVSTNVGDVPGVDLPTEKLPDRVCSALIKRDAASWEGPRSISFRYTRLHDGWTGGVSIETSNQYRELIKGRHELDQRLASALVAMVTGDVERVSLLYGVHGWKTPGPKLKLKRAKVEFVDLPPHILVMWNELVAYMETQGVKNIYYVDITVDDPDAKIREGEGIQIRYDR